MQELSNSAFTLYQDVDALDRYSHSSSCASSDNNCDSRSFDADQTELIEIHESHRLINDPRINLQLTYYQTPSFYFPNLNRNQAETLLSEHENGVFLIRDSVYYKGRLTLSIVVNRTFEHYIIEQDKQFNTNKISIDKIKWFDSINELIKYYQLNKDELPTQLTVGLSSNNVILESMYNIEKKFLIQINQLRFNEIIGTGEFANVRKGIFNNQIVAIKQIKDTSFLNQLLNEAKIMSVLNHENIVKLYGVSIPSKVFFVIEYMPNGNLLDFLRSRGRNIVNTNELIKFCYEISCGVEYLHYKKIIHCDLCASNILLDENKRAKICDFGLAISLKNENVHCLKYPTKIRIKWTAPESLNGRNFSVKSDVWSFSILLFEIFSFGRVPYPRIPIDSILNYLVSGNRMNPPENCPEEIYELMKLCWDLRQDKRPIFSFLKSQLFNMLN